MSKNCNNRTLFIQIRTNLIKNSKIVINRNYLFFKGDLKFQKRNELWFFFYGKSNFTGFSCLENIEVLITSFHPIFTIFWHLCYFVDVENWVLIFEKWVTRLKKYIFVDYPPGNPTHPKTRFPELLFQLHFIESHFPESRFPASHFLELRFPESHVPELRFAESRFPKSNFPESRFPKSHFRELRLPET
jgi:hypothetical protein